MRPFALGSPYDKGAAAFTPLASDTVDIRVLSAGGAVVHTIPALAKYVMFSSTTGDFYARFGGAAAIPSGDVTNGTGSMVNPSQRRIPEGVTTIGLIAPAAITVSLEFSS